MLDRWGVDLPSLVYWYSKHLCLIGEGGGRSAIFGVAVFKASMHN